MSDQVQPESIVVTLDQVLNTLRKIRNDAGNIPVKIKLIGEESEQDSGNGNALEAEGVFTDQSLLVDIKGIAVRKIEAAEGSPEQIIVVIE
jgi:hypothetical protein